MIKIEDKLQTGEPLEQVATQSVSADSSGEINHAAVEERPLGVAVNLAEMVLRIDAVETTLNSLVESVQILTRQQEIMQNSMRQLSGRVTEAASSLQVPRIRDLYSKLLLLYDLVEPPPAGLPPESVDLCKKLSIQIEQFLAVEGVERIATEDAIFDCNLHKPMNYVEVADLNQDNRVVFTYRHGFHSESSVLRPAEVDIGRFQSQRSQPDSGLPTVDIL